MFPLVFVLLLPVFALTPLPPVFHHSNDPLAVSDPFQSLPPNALSQFTSGHSQFSSLSTLPSIISTLSKPLPLPISLVLLPPPSLTLPPFQHFSSALRVESNGIQLDLKLFLPPKSLLTQVHNHPPSSIIPLLHPYALSLSTPNVVFFHLSHKPFVPLISSRMAILHISLPKPLRLPLLLAEMEREVKRLFLPQPLFWPVRLEEHVQLDVLAWTPGYERRAEWCERFDWGELERAVRMGAVNGQKVAFFSRQSNGESREDLGSLLDGMERKEREGVKKLVERMQGLEGKMRVVIVDMVKVRKDEGGRMEDKEGVVKQGKAVWVMRGKEGDEVRRNITRMFWAGVYGLGRVERYEEDDRSVGVLGREVVLRWMIRGMLDERVKELEELLQGLDYFQVDVNKMLDATRLQRFTNRLQLLLWKVNESRTRLHENLLEEALYLIRATSHDMSVILTVLNIDKQGGVERFRDPSIRCHFSRLRREAIRSAGLFEWGIVQVKDISIAILSFSVGMVISTVGLNVLSARKVGTKRA